MPTPEWKAFGYWFSAIASRASQVYVPPESAALLTKSAKESAQTRPGLTG